MEARARLALLAVTLLSLTWATPSLACPQPRYAANLTEATFVTAAELPGWGRTL